MTVFDVLYVRGREQFGTPNTYKNHLALCCVFLSMFERLCYIARTECREGRVIDPVLSINDLSISFMTHAIEVPAVTGFNCTVMPGEIVGLVGESGCGKSTVALAIMQFLSRAGRITNGTIHFLGENLVTASPQRLRQIRGSAVSMVYQEPSSSLNPSMMIGNQLAEVPIVHFGTSKEKALQNAREMLQTVRLPDPDRIMRSYPHQISGGQQQRVVIAMALLAKPKLLLMDEPTTALDVTVEAGIIDLLRDLSARFGASILFISHNLGLVRRTCDRVVVMYSGQAVESGQTHEVFDKTSHPYTKGLLQSLPVPDADKTAHTLRTIPGQVPLPFERPNGCAFGPRCNHFVVGQCDATPVAMRPILGSTDHFARCLRFDAIDWDTIDTEKPSLKSSASDAKLIEIDSLVKHYKQQESFLSGPTQGVVRAVDGVSFAARKGQTLALVGESGCGKSTLAKVLTGLEVATQGSIVIDGKEIAHIPVRRRDRDLVRNVQMIFQNPFDTLNPKRSVGAQIARVLKKFGIGTSAANRSYLVDKIFDSVRLPPEFAKRLPRQLSGGQKQRVAIARAFVGNPSVVVADEPVSALDASVQAAIAELLTSIQNEHGTTLVFISHDLGLVHHLADWVVVMYLGHVVEMGRTAEIFAPPYHPYTEALLSAVPIADNRVEQTRILLDGDIPSALNPPPGCPFQTRCPRKDQAQNTVGHQICETVTPEMRQINDRHLVKCHLSDEALRAMEPVIRIREPNT